MGHDKRKTGEWTPSPRLRSLDGWRIPETLYDRLDSVKHELGIPLGVSTEEFALDCMAVGLDYRLRLKIEAQAAAPQAPAAREPEALLPLRRVPESRRPVRGTDGMASG